jgi:hypothetical protein
VAGPAVALAFAGVGSTVGRRVVAAQAGLLGDDRHALGAAGERSCRSTSSVDVRVRFVRAYGAFLVGLRSGTGNGSVSHLAVQSDRRSDVSGLRSLVSAGAQPERPLPAQRVDPFAVAVRLLDARGVLR